MLRPGCIVLHHRVAAAPLEVTSAGCKYVSEHHSRGDVKPAEKRLLGNSYEAVDSGADLPWADTVKNTLYMPHRHV